MSASPFQAVMEAVAFAARAHQGQLRKDGRTPYFSHCFRVCLIVRDVFGIDDPGALTAAVLHDTIEDTTTDLDDLSQHFGPEVAGWVAALSKDKRLPEPERERAYAERLAGSPWQVKVCKLADIFDNLHDSSHFSPEQRAKTFRNAQRYLDALKENLPKETIKPWEKVSRLLADMEADATAGK